MPRVFKCSSCGRTIDWFAADALVSRCCQERVRENLSRGVTIVVPYSDDEYLSRLGITEVRFLNKHSNLYVCVPPYRSDPCFACVGVIVDHGGERKTIQLFDGRSEEVAKIIN